MKKIVSCLLSLLVCCFCIWPSAVFADDAQVIQVPLTIDANTASGGICWYSYTVTYDVNKLILLRVESNPEIFNNNFSKAVPDPEDQTGSYLVTFFRTGGDNTGITVNNVQGCVDYVSDSSDDVVVGYLYFQQKGTDTVAAKDFSFEPNENGGAVRAGTAEDPLDQPIILETAAAKEDPSVTAPVANVQQSDDGTVVVSTLESAEIIARDEEGNGLITKIYAQGALENAGSGDAQGVLKGRSLVVTYSDGHKVTYDLDGDEVSYKNGDYSYSYTYPTDFSGGETSRDIPVTVTFNPLGVEAKFTITACKYKLGDVNMDGEVDIFDAFAIRTAYFKETASQYSELGDYNGDGTVDLFDAFAIRTDYFKKGAI